MDETYIGGKPKESEKPAKRGRGTKKAPVLAMVERDGRVVSKPVDSVNSYTLKTAMREVIDTQSRVITDEFSAYNGVGLEYTGGHQIVNHSEKEYVRGDVYTNTAESYFALLKRGVHGTFHHISRKHLARYCDEFSFRWTYRRHTDGERAEEAVKNAMNKQISYKQVVLH